MKGFHTLSKRYVLITGCSSGGKSTLLNALNHKGFATIAEPGRRIVEEEIAGAGKVLPWIDMKAFANRAIEMARADLASVENAGGVVFFDRGLVDAAVALHFADGEAYRKTLGDKLHYWPTVFLAPPWPEIYIQDKERRHGFDNASEEFYRLEAALSDLGNYVCILPKVSVKDRVEFILGKI